MTCFGLLALLMSNLSGGPATTAEQAWVSIVEAPMYFAVLVEDVDAAVDWYRTAFGLRELDSSEAEDGSWRIVNLTNERLFVEIIRDDRARAVDRPRGFFKVGFQVPDVGAVADRVAAATGGRPDVVEFARHGVRIVQVRDPDGNIIQLSSTLDNRDPSSAREPHENRRIP